MDSVIDILRALHIAAAMLMAWPYYALTAVNQRAALGPPLGDRADRYLENILKNRTTACFVFQATILVGGFALIVVQSSRGNFPGYENWVIVAKIVILLLMAGSLSWVRFVMQPEIDRLFGDYGKLSEEAKEKIQALRIRRKKMSMGCMFLAFTAAVLGLQSFSRFPVYITAILVALIAVWAYRTYSSKTQYGWF